MVRVTGDKADISDRERRELEADLAAYLREQKFGHAPTNERALRAGQAPKATRTLPKAGASSPRIHRFEGPLEKLMQDMPADHYHAVDRLRWAEEARVARPKVGDWGDTPGGSDPSRRNGITEIQQKAAARYAYFCGDGRMTGARLSPGTMAVLEAMVFRQPNGEMPTVADAMDWARVWLQSDYAKYQSLAWKIALRRVAELVAWIDRDYGRRLERQRQEAREARERSFQQHRR